MPAEEFQFASTNIDRAAYDPDSRTLEVSFLRTGDTYTYQGVPADVWRNFTRSLSPGRFLATEIKGRYDI